MIITWIWVSSWSLSVWMVCRWASILFICSWTLTTSFCSRVCSSSTFCFSSCTPRSSCFRSFISESRRFLVDLSSLISWSLELASRRYASTITWIDNNNASNQEIDCPLLLKSVVYCLAWNGQLNMFHEILGIQWWRQLQQDIPHCIILRPELYFRRKTTYIHTADNCKLYFQAKQPCVCSYKAHNTQRHFAEQRREKLCFRLLLLMHCFYAFSHIPFTF